MKRTHFYLWDVVENFGKLTGIMWHPSGKSLDEARFQSHFLKTPSNIYDRVFWGK